MVKIRWIGTFSRHRRRHENLWPFLELDKMGASRYKFVPIKFLIWSSPASIQKSLGMSPAVIWLQCPRGTHGMNLRVALGGFCHPYFSIFGFASPNIRIFYLPPPNVSPTFWKTIAISQIRPHAASLPISLPLPTSHFSTFTASKAPKTKNFATD